MRIMIMAAILSGCLLISSCNVMKHSPCENKCEYNRRDCIQLCGDPNTAGFSLSLDGNWELGSVNSCIDGCNERSEDCLERCNREPVIK